MVHGRLVPHRSLFYGSRGLPTKSAGRGRHGRVASRRSLRRDATQPVSLRATQHRPWDAPSGHAATALIHVAVSGTECSYSPPKGPAVIIAGMMSEWTWLPLLIFLARIGDVSIGTIRMICVVRGQKLLAVVLGFFEIVIWIFAVSNVLLKLDQWVNIIAYAGGYATGNAVGMWIESRLAMGMQTISFMSRGKSQAVAERLRYAEHCVTTLVGSGRDGPVAICMAIVPRKRTPNVIRMAREIDPEVVITVEDVRESSAVGTHGSAAGKTPLAIGPHIWSRLRRKLVSFTGKGTPGGADEDERPDDRVDDAVGGA